MGDSVKRGSKEVQAVTFNLNQQRLLEKTLHTIELEESYAIKLLQLDDREVRLRQNNLKNRVSKIKSYLEPKDVKEIRELDMQGKLKPMYNSVNTNSALRISATARRLKMGPDGKPLTHNLRAKSSPAARRQDSVSPRLLGKRCNSITGVFIDAVESLPESREGRSSIDICSTYRNEDKKSPSLPPTPRATNTPRPITSNGFGSFNSLPKNKTPTPRSKTSAAVVISEPPHTDMPDGVSRSQDGSNGVGDFIQETSIASGSKHHQDIVTRPLSQYSISPRQSVAESPEARALSRYKRVRRRSSFSLGSFDKEQAKERMNEVVHERLEQQLLKTTEIQKKKKDFMKKINRWVEENPSMIKDTDGPYGIVAETKEQSNRPRSPFVSQMSFERNGEKLGFGDQFKELRKCRYLRIPDSKVDYSGVNTLVKDQLTVFNSSLRKKSHQEQEVQ